MLSTGLELLRSAIEAARSAYQLYSEAKQQNSPGKLEAAQERIAAAQTDLRLAEAQIALQLGYELCRCTFPPQIMTKVGVQLRGESCNPTEVDVHRCPACRSYDTKGGYVTSRDHRTFVVIP